MAQDRGKYKDVHVVRARGKSCLVSLCKILDQFDKGYSILHDADRETITGKKSKKLRKNSAWTVNQRILDVTTSGRTAQRVNLLASIPNFEEAFFGDVVDGDKPFSALARLRADETAFKTVAGLLDRLLDSSQPTPSGVIQWNELAQLKTAVDQLDAEPS